MCRRRQVSLAGELLSHPDGNYLYYDHADPANGNNVNLYGVPALGGASRQIVSDVGSAVSFSPDGKRMVYRRTIQDKGEDELVIANADGSNEQVIFRHESGINGFTTRSFLVGFQQSHRFRCIPAGQQNTACIHSGAYSRRQTRQEPSATDADSGFGVAARFFRVASSSVSKNRLLAIRFGFSLIRRGSRSRSVTI